MKLPNSVHTSQPWRIHEITAEFTLLDVWELPVRGTADDFDAAVRLMASFDPANAESLPTRCLWRVRDRLGGWLGLDSIAEPPRGALEKQPRDLTIPGTEENTLAVRLPPELRGTASGVRFSALPFVPLYRTDVEFAAELSNRTVHGVLHLVWVGRRDGTYEGHIAVYVKPRGALGEHYLRLIEPFRQLIVYPALLRQIGRTWASPDTDRAA